MDLFTYANQAENEYNQPLAARMRPKNLEEFIGQDDILGPGKFLRRMIEADSVPSLIFFGPPGTGKTTLALIIARTTGASYERVNAVTAGVADLRKIVNDAHKKLAHYRQRTILFIDEIHRFNKSQQDVLLPFVEDGTVILIGATTENPYFEVNSALLSRVRVIRLTPLSPEQIIAILKQALTDNERGLGKYNLSIEEDILHSITELAGGDARVALNILEQAAVAASSGNIAVTRKLLQDISGEKIQYYDKSGDNHYDVASAFIKSMRGTDADAALHYLARMLAAGEDVKFIARRMVICAAEDVGMADPQALTVAVAAAQAVQFVGMPEAGIILSQAVIYLATAPKSNSACLAISQALHDVKTTNCGPVPQHLKDSHYSGAKLMGHGKDYLYPHDYAGGFVRQQYLPDALAGRVYYYPTANGAEKNIGERVRQLRQKDTALNSVAEQAE